MRAEHYSIPEAQAWRDPAIREAKTSESTTDTPPVPHDRDDVKVVKGRLRSITRDVSANQAIRWCHDVVLEVQ